MLKPGILERRIVGEAIGRIERKGLAIVAMKLMMISQNMCEAHYSEHREKPFFDSLVKYMTSGPVVAMAIHGESAIDMMRLLCGATRVEEALPGTIRGDLALSTQNNVVHASDSPASAERELALFFDPSELHIWD